MEFLKAWLLVMAVLGSAIAALVGLGFLLASSPVWFAGIILFLVFTAAFAGIMVA